MKNPLLLPFEDKTFCCEGKAEDPIMGLQGTVMTHCRQRGNQKHKPLLLG
jgi:hypothetical protein